MVREPAGSDDGGVHGRAAARRRHRRRADGSSGIGTTIADRAGRRCARSPARAASRAAASSTDGATSCRTACARSRRWSTARRRDRDARPAGAGRDRPRRPRRGARADRAARVLPRAVRVRPARRDARGARRARTTTTSPTSSSRARSRRTTTTTNRRYFQIPPAPGQGILVMDLFIPGENAGPLKGDGRDFENPLRNPDLEETDSRVTVIIDRETGRGVIVQSQSCTVSVAGAGFCNEARPISINGDLGLIENDSENDATGEGINLDVTNNYNISADGDGVHLDYESRNSVSPVPAISGDVTFQPDERRRPLDHRGRPRQLPRLRDLPVPARRRGSRHRAQRRRQPDRADHAARPARPAEPARPPGPAAGPARTCPDLPQLPGPPNPPNLPDLPDLPDLPGPAGAAAEPAEPPQPAGPAGMTGIRHTMLARFVTLAALASALGGCGSERREATAGCAHAGAPKATVTPDPAAGSFPVPPAGDREVLEARIGLAARRLPEGRRSSSPRAARRPCSRRSGSSPPTRGTLSEVTVQRARRAAPRACCAARSADGGTGYGLLLGTARRSSSCGSRTARCGSSSSTA